MATVNVQSPSGDVSGTVELPESMFDVEVNIPLVHQVVVAQLAAARQGTHDTKSRGEVRGGGRKPYRQKGTGRARQGSTRAPQFVGGGVVHGPTPRSYAQRTPKKMKAAALRSALSDRARGGRLHVVSGLVEGDVPSTKTASAALAKIASSRHVLVVLERTDTLTWKSLRNVETVHVIAPDQLNTYDVLVADDLVFTEAALNAFVGGKQTAAEAAPTSEPAKKTAAKKAPAKKAAAKKVATEQTATTPATSTPTEPTQEAAVTEDAVTEDAAENAAENAAATDAGTTKPAGEGVSDDEAVAEVAEQTSADLKAEDVFEREAEGATTDAAAADADADEVAE
jgi:large subunit ribosomal protein L4